MIKILIIGLPGSGKTTLAKNILSFLNADWFNADAVRKNLKIGILVNQVFCANLKGWLL